MSETAVGTSVEQWLEGFGEALERGDAAAVAERFAEDGFWRDIVAFTWNIKTLEGRDAIRDMLEHTLEHTKPRAWRVTEPPAEADGITEAWLEFETEAGRGSGHLRLRADGQARTLLTTLY